LKKVYLATTNKWKVAVAKKIIEEQFGIQVIPVDLKLTEIQNDDAVEVVKAAVIEAYEKLKKPVIKSDSGIAIEALKGFPGPYSNYVERTIGIGGLIKLTSGLNDKTAKIYCIVCFFDGKQLKEFVGETKGRIIDRKKGKHGYFFDFIFVPDGQSKALAEFDDSQRWKFWEEPYEKFARWYLKYYEKK
jgi:XTP/dITP diphosphohydrolase